MALKTKKSIFYHIPKTGGRFVEKCISLIDTEKVARFIWYVDGIHATHPFGLFKKHTVPADIREEDKKGLFAYTFVRHPVSWYKSFFSFRVKGGGQKKMGRDQVPDLRFPLDRYWDSNFDKFMKNVLRAFPKGFLTRLYQYYVGEMDFIGRMENLREDLIRALILAREDFDKDVILNLRRQNTSNSDFDVDKNLERKILSNERWVMNSFYNE